MPLLSSRPLSTPCMRHQKFFCAITSTAFSATSSKPMPYCLIIRPSSSRPRWRRSTNTSTGRSSPCSGHGPPVPAVPGDKFSVMWEAQLAPPASGEYTLILTVAGADEAFRLYCDEALLLEKTAAESALSKEVVTTLNASQMPRLRLEYSE